MYKTCVLWFFGVQMLSVSLAVNPLPPRKSTKTIDCGGPIAFSATGSGPVHSTGLIAYKQNVLNLAVTWDLEVGAFTCACPGLYQFSFSGSTQENTKMVLRKKLNGGKQWSSILATKPGGGSATILLDIDHGDQVAVFLDGESKILNTSHEQGVGVTSFSGYRVAKT